MVRGLHTLLLCSLPLAVMSLKCYTCVFPAISPLYCVKFPQDCAPEQLCLYSTATAFRDSVRIDLQEKQCAFPSQCGLSGEKHTGGLTFYYSNKCCDTDLCNTAHLSIATSWRGLVFIFAMAVFFLLC